MLENVKYVGMLQSKRYFFTVKNVYIENLDKPRYNTENIIPMVQISPAFVNAIENAKLLDTECISMDTQRKTIILSDGTLQTHYEFGYKEIFESGDFESNDEIIFKISPTTNFKSCAVYAYDKGELIAIVSARAINVIE